MKKLFGGLKMTWPVVIVFAVLAGAFTALMALKAPDGSSFHEIAVHLEAWILFAILIITNCEKPLEAAVKTFVFFLISQPLVYLFQVPFSFLGWGLFRFYRYWFLVTLLTFPGAYLGWYIKKDSIWAGLILSVMLVLLIQSGTTYARDMAEHFPNHLLSTLFCFALVPLFIWGILKNRKARILALILCVLALALSVWGTVRPADSSRREMIQVDTEQYPVDESWTVEVEDESVSPAALRSIGDGDYMLDLTFHSPERNTVTLYDGAGNAYRFSLWYSESDGTHLEPISP